MPYCTQADLVDRFGEAEIFALARDESGTAIDTAVVERACDDASGEIDFLSCLHGSEDRWLCECSGLQRAAVTCAEDRDCQRLRHRPVPAL